jgi:hypothetical protein
MASPHPSASALIDAPPQQLYVQELAQLAAVSKASVS